MVETTSKIEDMQAAGGGWRRKGRRIALVPTMGFLHQGHLSLMRIARKSADILVTSIFVNPAQFGPDEDFETYPRDLQRDLDRCSRENVDLVFTPSADDLYPEGYETFVRLEHLPRHLCGLSRPIFFTGVGTVVLKLFNIVRPHVAVFGEKDYQQLLIIKKMVADLNMGVEIIGAPIVREPDGLAMSSRNAYLTAAQRPAAASLYQSLMLASEMVGQGVRKTADILDRCRRLVGAHPETDIDYMTICDPYTLADLERIDKLAQMAVAVRVGKTRLIDNMRLNAEADAPGTS